MHITDSHNHLHFDSFEGDIEGVLQRSRAADVKTMLLVGIDPEDSRKALKTAEAREGMFVSVGIHPQNAGRFGTDEVLDLSSSAENERVIAVGETGFDLYHAPQTIELQRKLFAAHISLARMLSKPLIIHDRQAHAQTLKLMDELDAWSLGGVFHCFSGDAEMAAFVVEHGYCISIPGVVTFKKAEILREVVKTCPMRSILVETDAPFLAPVPFRGKRNEPSYLVHTLEETARIKGCTLEEAADATTVNFQRLFRVKGRG